MKSLMAFASILALTASCTTGYAHYETTEQARTYQNGYAVTDGPKGLPAATMTAPITTDMNSAPGTPVLLGYTYLSQVGPKGKEAATMTLPVIYPLAPTTYYSGAPGTLVTTEYGYVSYPGFPGEPGYQWWNGEPKGQAAAALMTHNAARWR